MAESVEEWLHCWFEESDMAHFCLSCIYLNLPNNFCNIDSTWIRSMIFLYIWFMNFWRWNCLFRYFFVALTFRIFWFSFFTTPVINVLEMVCLSPSIDVCWFCCSLFELEWFCKFPPFLFEELTITDKFYLVHALIYVHCPVYKKKIIVGIYQAVQRNDNTIIQPTRLVFFLSSSSCVYNT